MKKAPIIVLVLLLFPVLVFSREKGITAKDRPLQMIPIETEFIDLTKLLGVPSHAPSLRFDVYGQNIRKTGRKDIPIILNDFSELDKLEYEQIIPAGESFVLKFDYQKEKLESIGPEFGLTEQARDALESAPQWMRLQLIDNFRRLNANKQNEYAGIINNSNKNVRDEIAFQVANLAPLTLKRMEPRLIEENANFIYIIEPDLKYVELVEYDDEENWYTTTRYRVLKDGDSVWVEIPKDIYYWWIVMPKLSDEQPSMNSSVYNEFWREHIYNNSEPDYPKLKDVLKDVKLLWDCQPHRWKNSEKKDSLDQEILIKYPFGDSLFAVQAIGRWVAHTIPINAISPRPIQPNQILHDNDGNCGELQDLLNAGARTALIPVLSVGSHPGDHVWNELYWDGEWWYYQVSWRCGPTDLNQSVEYKKKGLITAWRGDGYRYMVNEHYNPVCKFTFSVLDANQRPVDGAQIMLFCASYRDTHADEFFIGSWGYTDENGQLTVQLGTDINYGFRADWAAGHDPQENNRIYAIRYNTNGFREGGHLTATMSQGGGNMPPPIPVSQISASGNSSYSLDINYQVPQRINYGKGYWEGDWPYDDFDWSDFRDGGHVDFFICDTDNYLKYTSGQAFEAYNVRKNSDLAEIAEYVLPENQDYYLVFSNQTKTTVAQVLNYSVTLSKIVGVEDEINNPLSLSVAPNPASSQVNISFGIYQPIENMEISVYDIMGSKLATIFSGSANGHNSLVWDCRNDEFDRIPSGLYFIRLTAGSRQITRSIMVSE